MKAKVKLITLWDGPLPDWIAKFGERVDANAGFLDWELVRMPVGELNALAERVTGVPCRKESMYAACDLRPMYAELFPDLVRGHEWWGWLDLDVVLGDLRRLLGPFLGTEDFISTDGHAIHGPLTLLRNTVRVNTLWREDFTGMLQNPKYCNYDETGFAPYGQKHNDNPSFGGLVEECGRSAHYDDRSWTETIDPLPNGAPSRSVELVGNQLLEIPTGRELTLYHFTNTVRGGRKHWPLPNHWRNELREQKEHLARAKPDREPAAESVEFWSARVKRMLAEGGGWLHRAVFDAPIGDWEAIQAFTAKQLRHHVADGQRLLDVGCGYGALVPCLKWAGRKHVGYVGVDYCPEMVDLARATYPAMDFRLADARSLPFPDGSFDWAVCRGMEGTTKSLLSMAEWERMEREMLRVASKVLLLDMANGCRVVER